MDRKFYFYPSPDDNLWNAEVEKILPYCDGAGVDVGCGGRSISKDFTRVDIDPINKPDILAAGDNIPVKDNTFDFAILHHAFEHFDDQKKLLKEMVRIVKNKGYINIIHPDLEFTKEQLPEDQNPDLKAHCYNKHYHEKTQAQFVKWIKDFEKIGFKIFDYGVACGHWSFYVILRVRKESIKNV